MRRERIKQEAARFVVRLAESPSPRLRRDFEAWRDADVEHEIAFEREAAAWESLGRVVALRRPYPGPDGDLPVLYEADGADRLLTRRWAAAAAVAVCLTGGGLATFVLAGASPAYATGLGEQRTVLLPDGTTVELNTDSKIVVHYQRTLRSIHLVRGEAMFRIAQDPRPFLVNTPVAQLDARTADLSVRLIGDRIQVIVKDGVALANSTGASAKPQPSSALGPNSEAILGHSGVQIEKISTDEVNRMLAWREGAIVFNGQTLADAVAEFNRYNARQITIADAATRSIRVGGYFHTSDVDGFVKAVARTFPVTASERYDGGVLLARRI